MCILTMTMPPPHTHTQGIVLKIKETNNVQPIWCCEVNQGSIISPADQYAVVVFPLLFRFREFR